VEVVKYFDAMKVTVVNCLVLDPIDNDDFSRPFNGHRLPFTFSNRKSGARDFYFVVDESVGRVEETAGTRQ